MGIGNFESFGVMFYLQTSNDSTDVKLLYIFNIGPKCKLHILCNHDVMISLQVNKFAKVIRNVRFGIVTKIFRR